MQTDQSIESLAPDPRVLIAQGLRYNVLQRRLFVISRRTQSQFTNCLQAFASHLYVVQCYLWVNKFYDHMFRIALRSCYKQVSKDKFCMLLTLKCKTSTNSKY